MKIKRYIEFVNESKHSVKESDSLNVNTIFDSRETISLGLDKHYILSNHTINEDLSVDVDGDVNISGGKLTEIPFKFNIVKGVFDCSNNELTTLKNSPKNVGGDFFCYNNKLSSLKYCTQNIEEDFSCSHNKINTLKYSPKNIKGTFFCSHNFLKNLKYCPPNIGDDMYCLTNELTSLNGLPINFNLSNLYCGDNSCSIGDLKGNGLESILSENESNLSYHIDWIKNNKDEMPDDFKDKYGYLLEFEHYTKLLK